MKETLTGHQHAWRTLSCVLAALPMLAWGGASVKVTVKVTVVAQPCEINGGRPIEVAFGDVMTTEVDGKNYRRTAVEYTLSCPEGASSDMKLQIAGGGAIFDPDVLQIKPDELGLLMGIELQQGSTKLPINKWLSFTYPNKPELWAVPVKKSGATLKGGEFTAVATLKVDYQ